MQREEPLIGLAITAVLLLLAFVIVRGFFRWVSSWFAKPIPEQVDDDAAAMIVVTRPVAMPGGQWMHRVFKWEPCDAPIQPNNIEVHDVNDPKHNAKTCRHCNQRPGYSGVSYRPMN